MGGWTNRWKKDWNQRINDSNDFKAHVKSKVVLLHAKVALGVRGGIAPTLS
jgi:hypothetical protein